MMADSAANENTRTTLTAGRLAVWSWSSAGERLAISSGINGPLASLEGDWTLPQFLNELEGLSRTGVKRAVCEGDYGDVIDVHVTTRQGRSARMVGSFIDEGIARGLVVAGAANLDPLIARPRQLMAVYQPIYDLKKNAIAGFEALARWRMDDGTLAGPEDMDGHNIDWRGVAPVILEHSLSVLKRLRAAGHEVFMQVNVSAVEVDKPELVRTIVDILRCATPPAGALRIELTEQAALRDSTLALGALAALKAAGADLILDDFGAGHSSLVWLAEIPADGIKIDPKLVRLAAHKRGETILKALVRLMRDLKLSVTAEGIENRDLTSFFADIGCDYAQGFAFGRPAPEQALLAFLDRNT